MLIEAEKANYPIMWMCGLLGVPRSSFYAWRDRAQTATTSRRRELAEHVRRVFDNNRGVYGCRRVTAALNREGQRCSVGLVRGADARAGLEGLSTAGLQAHHTARRAAGPGPRFDRPGLHRRHPRAAAGRGRHLPAHRTGLGCTWPP